MKCYSSWKRNNPDTQGGESITITMTFVSFNKGDIDDIENRLPKGMVVSEYERADIINKGEGE